MPLLNRNHLNCRLGLVVMLTGLLAGCGSPSPQSSAVEVAPLGPPPVAAATPVRKPTVSRGRTIIVQPGQSLGRVAEAYHVPKQAIIAANKLTPPYELKTGSRLVIPGATSKAVAAASAPKAVSKPVQLAHAAAKPKAAAPAAKPSKHSGDSGEVIPLD